MASHSLAIPRKGLRDWMIQRLTALYLGVYIVFVVACAFILPAHYLAWRHLFGHFWIMIASIFALFAIIWHAWIGMWTIITDYINDKFLRIFCKLIVLAVLFAAFIWGALLFILLYL